MAAVDGRFYWRSYFYWYKTVSLDDLCLYSIRGLIYRYFSGNFTIQLGGSICSLDCWSARAAERVVQVARRELDLRFYSFLLPRSTPLHPLLLLIFPSHQRRPYIQTHGPIASPSASRIPTPRRAHQNRRTSTRTHRNSFPDDDALTD